MLRALALASLVLLAACGKDEPRPPYQLSPEETARLVELRDAFNQVQIAINDSRASGVDAGLIEQCKALVAGFEALASQDASVTTRLPLEDCR